MSQRTSTQRRSWKERALSLLLTAALVAGLIPGLALPASADHWADAYLDQLVDWGVMRADQTENPDAELTRAEFFAIINRAYGYTEPGYIPFTDVLETDWFYDDISIAYNAGYMAGTSQTTASPNDPLTREQAFCILGRNMMLTESPGESLAFVDSRDVSDWARGTIKAAADRYIVSGFPDNTLHPQDSISKGQMAVLISQCLGTPIRESGAYDLGGVFGNVTITAPNVTLRNATISGDLYISGGVGLGGIKLENVDVLGRIIVSSTGESEGGDASVIMRNVTADEMLVDNMRNKTVTIRADGITNIANTIVRTNAYLEDNNTDEEGLLHIEVDGDPGLRLTLAGRIKEVVNKTPASYIQAAKGTVAKLTVDEAATNSGVEIDRNTKISEVNLDVATSVLGDGDIGHLNVNAPGSVVSMLPDDIYVRPGLTANIAGVIMDYQSAQEGSLDPRLLSGYPAAKDIAPTGFRADFAGNKKGTVYWAVSYVSDGSIGEDDLVSPPSYGNKAIANGSVAEPAGGDEVSAQVGNLVVGGSYYLSAILVDEQRERSPVKVISFSTPDNTVPAFGQGYPYMSRTTCSVAQVTVMPTKSCKLYYALLPQGAKAPTANELKAAAVTGNLGYGMRDVTKNTEDVFQVNGPELEELKTYVLYLWLTDVDGANSSNVVSLSFTTPDETPPKFNPEASPSGDPGQTNVPLTVGLNEPGTIYWIAVLRGATYPAPDRNNDSNNAPPNAAGIVTGDLKKDWSKLQVMNGNSGGNTGTRTGSLRIANADTPTAMNITGLARETAYDLYYVAVDNAGNFSESVMKLAINTLDETPPTVKQTFSRYAGRDNTRDPLVTTDIMLEFSEDFRSISGVGNSILDIWSRVGSADASTSAAAKDELYTLLSDSIRLYQTSTSSRPEEVKAWDGVGETPAAPWINLHNAAITSKDGKVTVTLPHVENSPSRSAHQLRSGSTYYFQVQDIEDNSGNDIVPNPVWYDDMGASNLPTFTTVFAQVHLSNAEVASDRPYIREDSPDVSGVMSDATTKYPRGTAEIDYTFRMIPDATEAVDETNSYDIQFYTGSNVSFDLYCRIYETTGSGGRTYVTKAEKASGDPADTATAQDAGISPIGGDADDHNWFYLGNSGSIIQDRPGNLHGVSVNKKMANLLNFPTVSSLKEKYNYDFVITITSQSGVYERGVWTGTVGFELHVLAGQSHNLVNLANEAYQSVRETATGKPLTQDGLVSIGATTSGDNFLTLTKTFLDTRVPHFDQGFPVITPGDSFADVAINLDRKGTIYYVAAPLTGTGAISPRGALSGSGDLSNSYTGQALWQYLPQRGQNELDSNGDIEVIYKYTDESDNDYDITINTPNPDQIMSQNYPSTSPHGIQGHDGNSVTVNIPLRGLSAERDYIIYFVLKGEADEPSDVFAYRFKTTRSSAPKLQLTDRLDGNVSIDTSTGNVESALKWIVFSHDSGMGQLETLQESYGMITVPASIDADDEGDGNELNDGKVTWYYALTHIYTYSSDVRTDLGDSFVEADHGAAKNGYTLFDVFADPTQQKPQLSRLLYSPGALGSALTSSTSSNEFLYTRSESGYVAFADWLARSSETGSSSRTYLIIAAGHNVASSEDPDYGWALADSYRALDEVSVVDSDPPKLMQTDRGVVLDNGVYGDIRYSDGLINADITLVFDKPLYWRPTTNGTKYRVVGGIASAAGSGDDAEVGIMSALTTLATDGTKKVLEGGGTIEITGGGDFFEIHIRDMAGDYASLSFLSSGTFTNETGTNTNGKLSLVISRTSSTSGTTITHSLSATVRFYGDDVNQTAVIANTVTENVPQAGSPTNPPKLQTSSSIEPAGSTSPGDSAFGATVKLVFDQGLYTFKGREDPAPVSRIIPDTSSYLTEGAAGNIELSSTTTSKPYTTYNINITGIGQSTLTAPVIFTLLPNDTLCNSEGVTTSDQIKIEVSKTETTGASPDMKITHVKITIYFGEQKIKEREF